MIKRILIPIDGSPSSEIALRLGLQLAKRITAEVSGLFVEDERRFQRQPPETMMERLELPEAAKVEIRPKDEVIAELQQIENEEERLRHLFKKECTAVGIEGRFIAQFGEAATDIIEIARRVDLVVLGNRGTHSGLHHAKDGETVMSLLRETTRPVLVCPNDWGGYDRLVIGYDGTPSSERVLQCAAEFAEVLNIGEVHLVSVDDPTKPLTSSQDSAVEYLKEYSAEVTSVTRSGEAFEEILSYAEQVDADIIALGAFGLNKLRDLVFGSTTASVVQRAKCGVLLSP